jgi:nucleoside-diphosphate-sugar epimerase
MVYVTGASGFLGKHLVKELGQVTPIPHDKISTTKITPFDKFFFLSSYGNLFTQGDSQQTIQANVLDLISIMKQAVIFPFRSFVYVSTSSVKLPIQTFYSRTKKMAEELLLAYMEKYKLPIVIVRPFSITGVGEHKQHLIPTLIHSCFNQSLVNFTPTPCHDYIDVDDVVSGILSLSEGVKGIYELGSGVQYSNQQVLNIVEGITGNKVHVNIINEGRTYDTDRWVSSNFKARGFGWLPKKTLEQSIEEMVQDYWRETRTN